MKTKNLRNKLVVITGGSSGIGLALAERARSADATVLLVARNTDKLDSAVSRLGGGSQVHAFSADVTRATDVRRLHKHIRTLAPATDLLINSAGVVSAGLLHEVPMAEWDRLHATNVRGLVMVLRALIPDMIEQAGADGSRRHIVNVSSMAGFAGIPGMSAYGATKAAVTALSESLRGELAPHRIGVTALCPGYVKTPIAETLQFFGRMDTPRMQKVVRQSMALGGLSPESVARRTMKAVARNKGVLVLGAEATVSQTFKRFVPELYLSAVAKVARASGKP